MKTTTTKTMTVIGILALALGAVTGCGKPDGEAAMKRLATQHLKESLHDWKSYEPVKWMPPVQVTLAHTNAGTYTVLQHDFRAKSGLQFVQLVHRVHFFFQTNKLVMSLEDDTAQEMMRVEKERIMTLDYEAREAAENESARLAWIRIEKEREAARKVEDAARIRAYNDRMEAIKLAREPLLKEAQIRAENQSFERQSWLAARAERKAEAAKLP
jgi:hypothetical protein